MAEADQSITGVLDSLRAADHGGATSVGDVLDTLEERPLGALITGLGLIAAIPVVGAIPGVSIAIGLLVAAVVLQSLIRGHAGLWAPGFVRRREISDERFDEGVDRAKPYARWVDHRMGARLTALTAGRPQRVAVMICAALLGLAMIPLAVVPWGVMPPALALVALGLALMTRDGVAALIGYLCAAGTVWMGIWAL